jgi:hypothetical protein
MQTTFALRIFVADGDPDGLRIVDKSNWIGKALVFPRALLPQVKARPELAQTGVYLLLGPRPDGEGDMLYVGEGDPIRPRLESHYAQKDFWTRAIGFTTTTAGQLNKAHVLFLESRLIALARAAKRMPLDNANQPAEPTLSEAHRADMEVCATACCVATGRGAWKTADGSTTWFQNTSLNTAVPLSPLPTAAR